MFLIIIVDSSIVNQFLWISNILNIGYRGFALVSIDRNTHRFYLAAAVAATVPEQDKFR